MAFLLGAFGTGSHTKNMKQRAVTALEKAGHQPAHVMVLPHGVICAGQNNKHTRQYNHVFPLEGDGGILVGKLFERSNNKPFTLQHEIARQCSQNPSLLYQHLWGRFVGALYHQITHKLTLVRDPIGLSTLFYSEQPNGVLFSTDMSLLYDILEEKPSLDLSYFAEYIINQNQALPSTPLQEIKELLPGMALTVDAQGKSSQRCMWDISSLKGSYIADIADEHEMEEQLLAALKSSMKAWTHDTDGICVELSGGLDSSATLITLREVLPEDKKIVAVNFIDSKTPSSNENVHAQEVADMCNVPLHLIDWHGIPLLTELPAGWLPNRPSTFLFSHSSATEFYNFATSQGCYEIANGQGGDHVFLAPPPSNALADYWLDKGLKGITTPLKNISAAHRTSWPSLIYESAQAVAGYYRSKHTQTNAPIPFLTPEYANTLSQHDFYLKRDLAQFYPARAMQIQSLSHAIAYADRDQRSEQTVILHPLLSLPIVELALKIPTYQSFDETYDRIFFRRAAAKMKPSKALWRTIKGQTTGTLSKSCVQEADKITELLLQGTLVRSGIINKTWLQDELIKIRHGKADNMWPLLHLMTSQLWLNQWRL